MHHAERYSEKVCAAHDPPEGQLAIGFASILLFFFSVWGKNAGFPSMRSALENVGRLFLRFAETSQTTFPLHRQYVAP